MRVPGLLLAFLAVPLAPVDDPCTVDAVLPFRRHDLPFGVDDDFGKVVDADGDRIVVAAPTYDGKGAVVVFDRVNGSWAVEGFLSPAGLANGAQFGASLDLAGDLLVVGAAASEQGGAAYVYRYDVGSDEWELEDTLPAGGPEPGFGSAVSTDGDRIAVVEPGNVVVYLQVSGVWTVEDDTIPSPLPNPNRYGDDLAIAGDLLIVSDDAYDLPPPSYQIKAGIVYVFHRNGSAWEHADTIENPFPDGDSDHFGEDVDLDGCWAVVGCPRSDADGVFSSGSAFVYELDGDGTVLQEQELDRGIGGETEIFGHGVAIRGTTALVGAPEAMVGGFEGAGLGYQFDLVSGTWGLTAEFPRGTPHADDEFGTSMGLGDFGVAGAPNVGRGPGRAFVGVPCAP